jgi:hypothetical protein
MSKRFGRNQKRRLTEQLTLAQNTNQALIKTSMSAQREVLKLRAEIRDIHREICEAFNEYHPLLNKTVSVDRPDMERIEIAQCKQPSFNVNSLDANPIEFSRRIVHLLRLESWPDEYRQGIAFKAMCRDKVVGYYADNIRMIRDDRAVPHMAGEIARNMFKMLKGDKR